MFDVEHIIKSGGLLLVALIIFSESGLLVGFFLPGDTLLFAAGFFAAQGQLPLGWLLVVLLFAAILGFNTGYSIGRRTGHRIFRKEDGILFRKQYITQAEEFYKKHGGKAIMLARFVPVVRTIAPLLAGVGKMNRGRFLLYNVLGGVIWIFGVTMLGYILGDKIPNIDKYILPIIGLAMLFTFSPTMYHIFKEPRARTIIRSKIKTGLRSIFLIKR